MPPRASLPLCFGSDRGPAHQRAGTKARGMTWWESFVLVMTCISTVDGNGSQNWPGSPLPEWQNGSNRRCEKDQPFAVEDHPIRGL